MASQSSWPSQFFSRAAEHCQNINVKTFDFLLFYVSFRSMYFMTSSRDSVSRGFSFSAWVDGCQGSLSFYSRFSIVHQLSMGAFSFTFAYSPSFFVFFVVSCVGWRQSCRLCTHVPTFLSALREKRQLSFERFFCWIQSDFFQTCGQALHVDIDSALS